MCIGSSSTPAIGSSTTTSTMLTSGSIGGPQDGPTTNPAMRSKPPTILGGSGAGSVGGRVNIPATPNRANSL